jgi:hypothetical protein
MNHPDVIRRGDLKYNDNRYLRVGGSGQTVSAAVVFTGPVTVSTFELPYGWSIVCTPTEFNIYQNSVWKGGFTT